MEKNQKVCCGEKSKQGKKLLKLNVFLKTIQDANRLRILCLLTKNKELCVCEIFKALALPQNLVSHHLGRLRKAGLLLEKRQGKFIIYSVNKNVLKEYKDLFNQIIKD